MENERLGGKLWVKKYIDKTETRENHEKEDWELMEGRAGRRTAAEARKSETTCVIPAFVRSIYPLESISTALSGLDKRVGVVGGLLEDEMV
jgi:hypothetical protein